jgi:hypothetical protein
LGPASGWRPTPVTETFQNYIADSKTLINHSAQSPYASLLALDQVGMGKVNFNSGLVVGYERQ